MVKYDKSKMNNLTDKVDAVTDDFVTKIKL